jgi:hypothetical protein
VLGRAPHQTESALADGTNHKQILRFAQNDTFENKPRAKAPLPPIVFTGLKAGASTETQPQNTTPKPFVAFVSFVVQISPRPSASAVQETGTKCDRAGNLSSTELVTETRKIFNRWQIESRPKWTET